MGEPRYGLTPWGTVQHLMPEDFQPHQSRPQSVCKKRVTSVGERMWGMGLCSNCLRIVRAKAKGGDA